MSAEDVTQTPGFRLRDLILRGAAPPAAFVARLACYPWLIVGVTCIGAFIGQLDASIVQLALPALGRTFDATLESVSWVALGYLLAFASFLPIFGQLCDIYGRKLLYLIGSLLFAGASALCGLAPDPPTLVAFRVLQGVGGAMLGANSISVLVSATDKSLRARALGVFAAAQAVGVSAGPASAVFCSAAFGWPSVFWVTVPFGLAAVLIGWLVLPQTPAHDRKLSFDWRGALLRAGLDAGSFCAQPDSALGPTSPGAHRLRRRRRPAADPVRSTGARVRFAARRSKAISAACLRRRRHGLRLGLRHPLRHVFPHVFRAGPRL